MMGLRLSVCDAEYTERVGGYELHVDTFDGGIGCHLIDFESNIRRHSRVFLVNRIYCLRVRWGYIEYINNRKK